LFLDYVWPANLLGDVVCGYNFALQACGMPHVSSLKDGKQLKTDAHILIVDDDKGIRDLLREFFEKRGMRATVAADGDEMDAVLKAGAVDLIVLDIMLPGRSGLELCREIRARQSTPIIMLTAVSETTDRVVGLEMGADDYMPKPFDPHELLARVRAVLRRKDGVETRRPAGRNVYHFAGWTMDCSRRRLTGPEDVLVELTGAEFNLLHTLVRSPQRVLTRDQLIDLSGGDAGAIFDRSIDILVSRLRRKMEDDPKRPELIQTVRSGGYQFMPEVTQQ
jgi:two-component system, OmpR family, response regulator